MSKGASVLSKILGAMASEFLRGCVVAAIALLILAGILWLGGDQIQSVGDTPWWMTDADGRLLLETFPAQAWKTTALVIGALFITLPFALLLSILVTAQPTMKPLRYLIMTVSGTPVFVLAYLFVGSDHQFFLAATTLAIADLSLGGAISVLEPVIKREMGSPHARAARAKGASLVRHLWRPVAVATLLSLRTRLPVLFASTVVAERIFNIAGLGDQAVFSVLERADVIFLVWFALFTVLFTRLALVLARSIEAGLVPQSRDTGFSKTGFFEFLQSALTSVKKPEVTVAIPLIDSAKRPWRKRQVESLRRFFSAFGMNSREIRTRLSGFFLVTPVWIVALGVLIGALFVKEPMIYGDEMHLGAFQGGKHWLGTDGYEEDVLALILLGARNAFPYWALAVFIPTFLGLIMGTLSAFKSTATVFELIMEGLDALPKLVVVLLTVAALGVDRYVEVAYPMIGLVFAPFVYARVRARIDQLIRTRFVEAEQVAGATPARALFLHVVWSNLRGVVLSCAAYVFGGVVLLDATCGYLQVAQRELCAWGALVYDGVQGWNTRHGIGLSFNEWSVYAPMLAATTMILAWTYLGDGLTAAFSHDEANG
ncbi:MAG: hypothetical protein P1V97_23145 [Planctomycetota bacterium]|nr:hypothetical protein [Planctomycetota bacterium]